MVLAVQVLQEPKVEKDEILSQIHKDISILNFQSPTGFQPDHPKWNKLRIIES